MRLIHLKTGVAFKKTIPFFVSKRLFARCLAEYFDAKGDTFPERISRSESKHILGIQLHYYGVNGVYQDGYFDSLDEFLNKRYDECYQKAKSWVAANYPELDEK